MHIQAFRRVMPKVIQMMEWKGDQMKDSFILK